jgi:hypothetical protein
MLGRSTDGILRLVGFDLLQVGHLCVREALDEANQIIGARQEGHLEDQSGCRRDDVDWIV